MRTKKKLQLDERRRWRIRKKVHGTKDRPRMSVKFTGQHIYVQFVDDAAGATMASISTRAKSLAGGAPLKANVTSAKRIGALAGESAKTAGITRVVFDRSGARYHGKVKALADAAREVGLQF